MYHETYPFNSNAYCRNICFANPVYCLFLRYYKCNIKKPYAYEKSIYFNPNPFPSLNPNQVLGSLESAFPGSDAGGLMRVAMLPRAKQSKQCEELLEAAAVENPDAPRPLLSLAQLQLQAKGEWRGLYEWRDERAPLVDQARTVVLSISIYTILDQARTVVFVLRMCIYFSRPGAYCSITT